MWYNLKGNFHRSHYAYLFRWALLVGNCFGNRRHSTGTEAGGGSLLRNAPPQHDLRDTHADSTEDEVAGFPYCHHDPLGRGGFAFSNARFLLYLANV